ncbi:chemotaxis protein CheB [Fulvivirga sediminis]|uniref:PAS domain-containing protein n=1 Tax=Fulvivirga sediminis TaxID=2803949 RepID=A0A937F8D5_9BACT|nr:chemotaxis protein CheB [Fulvivirga sediminis]MBL3658352.1 PAS domain-containing protein [Fulvivirga sediminis]
MEKNNTVEYLVAIGASAGGLAPLQELVESLPERLDNVAIIVAQHLSPEYKSMLTEIISRKTVLNTTAIEDGVLLEPNHIYVTPPNCDAIIKDTHLEITDISAHGPRPSIDKLFTSMAKSYGKKAVGIILSGTGQDGSQGIVALKKAGGLTISQDLASSKYSGMPQAAMTTGMIDVVLPPSEIGSNLLNLIKNKPFVKNYNKQGVEEEQEDDFESSDDISTILHLLEAKIGTDFSNYKESTIVRRLEKRLHDKGFSSVEKYLNYIRNNEDELEEFFKYLLIGVTSFFRDAEAFKMLEQEIEERIKTKDKRERFRVWVPGCATGEESVSLAIMINEILIQTNRYDIKLQIFATDINANALKDARSGIYSKEKLENLPEKLINKYFEKSGENYELVRDIKQSILYTKHDITSNPPFLRLDLVSCRNLFIYFNQRLQNHIFPIFQYALLPDGLLFLGKSETVGNYKNIFSTVNAKYRIFSRKERTSLKPLKLPSTKPLSVDKKISATRNLKNESLSIHEMVKETVYNTYESPYVIIDENMDIIEISGDTNEFLKIRPGLANMNLLRLITEDLQIVARALVTEAIKSMKIARGEVRRYSIGDQKHLARLIVKPLIYSKPGHPYFMVIFESFDIVEPFFASTSEELEDAHMNVQHMQELEYELISNKQHMNTLVQELETTNEELQALNEELQSSNEELQASNEELETSNEELQATNEELENAYVDLRVASQKLTRQKQMMEQIAMASPDLIAVITGDALIFEYVNPSYQNLFSNKKLEGRSMNNANAEFMKLGFMGAINEVQETGKAFHMKEVEYNLNPAKKDNKKSRYFNFSFAPLASEDSSRPDIVIYGVDVSEPVRNRKVAEDSAKFFKTLAESMPQKIWTIDHKGHIAYMNYTLKTYLDVKGEDYSNVDLDECIYAEDLEKVKKTWKEAIDKQIEYTIQYRLYDSNQNYHWHLVRITPLLKRDGSIRVWICTATDIHEQKTIEQKKDEFMGIASHELKTPLTTAKAYMELLKELLIDEEVELSTVRTYSEKALVGMKRLSSLVGDLLDVTRIQTGKLHFELSEVDFDQVVVNATDISTPLSNQHDVIFKGDKTNVKVRGNGEKLEQVMVNLISNAIKYSSNANKVLIATSVNEGKVCFKVTDFGNGIPPQYQSKIFERFYRVQEKEDFSSGLGIGLYISKQIIEAHEGTIGVKSKEGEGSEFFIELPIV